MKNLIALCLLLSSLTSLSQPALNGALSHVAVLTIHVSDTNVHAGVFKFLTEVLQLPVDYEPVMLGERRYAAVYAGNLFIEPCGPYRDWHYPVGDFKALFFGLNCVSSNSPAEESRHLDSCGVRCERPDAGMFVMKEPSLVEGIYLAVSTQPPDKAQQEKELQLAAAFAAKQKPSLGLAYVKEIWLGDVEPATREAWSRFLGAPGGADGRVFPLNRQQSIRFVPSKIKGVRAIVCKVDSLPQSEEYLKRKNCYGRRVDGRIELNKAATFGLAIYLE